MGHVIKIVLCMEIKPWTKLKLIHQKFNMNAIEHFMYIQYKIKLIFVVKNTTKFI